jgi:hypothetical protein
MSTQKGPGVITQKGPTQIKKMNKNQEGLVAPAENILGSGFIQENLE